MSTTEAARTLPSHTTYSTQEAALVAGISYRMLDYWLRNGTVQPEMNSTPGSGHQRRWTPEDVDVLCRVVACWRLAQATVDDFRAGDLWNQMRQR